MHVDSCVAHGWTDEMANQWGQGREMIGPNPQQCGDGKNIRSSQVLFYMG